MPTFGVSGNGSPTPREDAVGDVVGQVAPGTKSQRQGSWREGGCLKDLWQIGRPLAGSATLAPTVRGAALFAGRSGLAHPRPLWWAALDASKAASKAAAASAVKLQKLASEHSSISLRLECLDHLHPGMVGIGCCATKKGPSLSLPLGQPRRTCAKYNVSGCKPKAVVTPLTNWCGS